MENLTWFDAVAAGVLVRDLAGNLVAYNRTAERVLQGFLDPLEGPPAGWFSKLEVVDEHGDPLDPESTPGTVAARVGIEITDHVLGLVEPGTGRRIWIRAGAVPLRDDAGIITGSVVTFEEIGGRKEVEDHDRVAVALLDLLGSAGTLETFVDEMLAVVRDATRLETLAVEAVRQGSGRTHRAGVPPAEDRTRVVRIACRGQQLGSFLVDREEATARPWAFRQLEALAPLVGQGLFRFGIEALLGVAQEADRALAAIRAIALADVPGLFDQTLEVLAGVSFLGPEAGCHLTLEEPDADVGSPLDRHRCASCAGDPAPAAAGEGPRREAGVELPIRSPRGDGFGRLSVCDPSGRTRSWQELEFLQAVSETLGTAIERRRAEEKATAGEARYRRIVENCAEAIAKLDPEGRFTFANGRLAELLGVPADRLLGESVWRFVGDEDRAEAEAIFGRLRHGGTERVDFRLRRADGTLLQTQVSAVGLTDAEGRPRGFLGMITDLTQHRRAEEMLRQAQKMEALGHLARGIAHDFNNLLSVILGTADVLRRELPEGDPHGEDLDEIRDAGRRAARLTKQLLAFARADRGTPELVEPDHAVAGMEGLLRNAIGETVALELDLEAEPWSIRIDPGYLEQVLVNLAVNAREAMPGGGTLAIATRKLPGRPLPSIPGPGNWVELRVRDTGRGIPPDDLPRIFEPFFTTKEKGRGSGLGLPTVFGIVEQAGGKIAIDSEPGRGTTVTAWLPAAPIEAEEAAPPGTPRPPRAAAGETILVAEDEVAIRSLARRVLEGHGYRVLEAGDGERALAVLCGDAERVDLLLADVVMPRMSATELLERLPADRRPAVLLMSGYGGDVAPASDEPRAGFLAKPFTAVGLLEAVGRVLGPVRSAVESPGQ